MTFSFLLNLAIAWATWPSRGSRAVALGYGPWVSVLAGSVAGTARLIWESGF
jgi:hypothetical protein